MTVTNDKAVTCPRCGEVASVEFKFCPACAYRLTREAPVAPIPAERTSIWPHVLLLLGALTLIGGFVLAGIALFRDQPAQTVPPITVTPPLDSTTPRHVLGFEAIAGDLVEVPEGDAEFRKEQDEYGPVYQEGASEPNVWPVRVSQFRMTRYEISRAQWGDFLQDIAKRLEADPDVLGREYEGEFKRLFDPLGYLVDTGDIVGAESGDWLETMAGAPAKAVYRIGTNLHWAEGYVDKWWQAVANHILLATERDIARPADLRLPLSPRWRLMMLVPPMWVRADQDGRLEWELPSGTENLPVTGVALFDANAFAAWASEKLSMSLYVPTAAEFRRAYHGGRIPREEWELSEEELRQPEPDLGNHFPWGSEPHLWNCNSLNFWGRGFGQARLLPVNHWFGARGGTTQHGLYSMAGNAREWTHPQRYVLRQIREAAPDVPSQKEYYVQYSRNGETATMGGSYLTGIDDCSVTKSQNEDVRARAVDLGFRLAMR
jgi:formylglycine-generating enzyme required for sulfatase activity